MKEMKNGLLITLEGMEGSGKTTQIQRLAAVLTQAGYAVCVTREPGGCPISERIRELFLNPNTNLAAMKSGLKTTKSGLKENEMVPTTELLLMAAARAQHVAEVILPALQDRQIVISDRFSDATVVYQGYRRGLDLELIRQMNRIATGGLSPDRTFVLDLPVAIGLQRVQRRQHMNRLDLEDFEAHTRVREGYLAIASEAPDRIKVIDAQADVDRIHQWIKAELDGLLRTLPRCRDEKGTER